MLLTSRDMANSCFSTAVRPDYRLEGEEVVNLSGRHPQRVHAQASLVKEVLEGSVADPTLGLGPHHHAHSMVERGRQVVEARGVEAEAQLSVRGSVRRMALARPWALVAKLTIGHDGPRVRGRDNGTRHNVPLDDITGLFYVRDSQ